MKALICPALGPAETLKVMDIDPPAAGSGEVTVDVVYAALNFFDTLIIEGSTNLSPNPRFPRRASSPAASRRWGRMSQALRSATG